MVFEKTAKFIIGGKIKMNKTICNKHRTMLIGQARVCILHYVECIEMFLELPYYAAHFSN